MNYPRRYPHFIIVILLILVALACQLPQTTTSTPTNVPFTPLAYQADPTTATSQNPLDTSLSYTPTPRPTSPPEVAEHRITTHRIYGIAEFYDRGASNNLIPRGANYSMLIPILDHYA